MYCPNKLILEFGQLKTIKGFLDFEFCTILEVLKSINCIINFLDFLEIVKNSQFLDITQNLLNYLQSHLHCRIFD